MKVFRITRGDHVPQELHEINVTPFIDVMLVLVVIFMAVAPLSSVNVPVELPTSNASNHSFVPQAVFLTIRSDKTLLLDDKIVSMDGIKDSLNRQIGKNQDQKIYIKADKHIDYATLMVVMDVLRDIGYLHVSLIGLGKD